MLAAEDNEVKPPEDTHKSAVGWWLDARRCRCRHPNKESRQEPVHNHLPGICHKDSRGRGRVEHFSEVFAATGAEAALAAGIFHRREVEISAVKEHMQRHGIEVRL